MDGLYVAFEGRPDHERKFERTDGRALLGFLPDVYTPTAGGVLVAVRDSFVRLEESKLSELPAVRALYDSLLADGRPPDAAFELAVRLHRAVMKVRPGGWRGIRAREQVIKRTLYEILRDEEKTERIFQDVKKQPSY